MITSLPKRLLGGLVALAVVVAGGTAGYWVIGEGRWTPMDCLYMTVISVTTVGYGEILTGMDQVVHARLFTVALLILGTGSIVYFASMITAFIVEGELQTLLKAQQLKKRIRRMKEHIVVCGAGSTGRNIIEELVAVDVPVVAIDTNEHTLRELVDRYPKAQISYLVGDATDDEIMAQAAMATARGVVVALSSDKDNLYVVVSARQLNSKARIVARCAEMAHVDKIKRAGADSVVSPNFIGGVRMVSEMLRPTVVRFLDEMLRDRRATYRIDEVSLVAGSPLIGQTLRGAKIRDRFGMSVLALKGTDSPWQYNPTAEDVLVAGMIVVVLGSVRQVAELRAVAAGAAMPSAVSAASAALP
ncbi:MAG TPA: potassium channel protein [Kofleriaceae bacterium]|jgi:voltage-gated potassium channel|nr:potassium channel protein [Kofleriaceae bacterium]